MRTALEALKVKLAVSVWRRKEGKLAEAIRGFQATEADGVWHLHRGLERLEDPRKKAILFTHSLEEEAHAEEFAKAYAHYGERVMTPATYERKDLYAASEPPWKTFAYVHVGEREATGRFRLIHQAIEPGVLRNALGTIITDEEGHVDLTHHLLVQLGATERQIRGELRRVMLLRWWEAWLRVGKRAVDNLATVLLTVAYFVLGPFVFLQARKKLSTPLVEFDNNRLKSL